MTKVILLLVFLALAFCDFLGDAKICTQSTGDLDRDIEYCTRAIQSGELSDEDLVITFYTRGVAYYYKGEYDPALRDFDQAIKLNPDFAQAFDNRGLVYYYKSDNVRAIRDFDQAIRLKPDFATTPSTIRQSSWQPRETHPSVTE